MKEIEAVAIIQARMGSERFPKKVLKEVLGKSLLEYQLERVLRSKELDRVCVATTELEQDNPIVNLCQKLGVAVEMVMLDYYRGSSENVLERFYTAASLYRPKIVVRLTADCPLIDPEILDFCIKSFKEETDVDYLSNSLERTYPRGMDVEVFSFLALIQTYYGHQTTSEEEHVTPYMRQNPSFFKLKSITSKYELGDMRLTVDTKEDFSLIKKIIETLYPNNPKFLLEDILDLLEKNPGWLDLNAHIQQKEL